MGSQHADFMLSILVNYERLFAFSTFLTILCPSIFLGWAVWTTFIYPFYISPLRHLPMPKGNHWLWGHGIKLLREPQGNPSKQWLYDVPHDGIIRYLTFFNRERLIIYSPKLLASVLTTNCYDYHKPSFLSNPMKDMLGNGLLVSEGDHHRVQKRSLLPAFTRRQIDRMYPTFCSKARETILAMTTALSSEADSEIDISNWASRYALDVIGLAGFGKDFGAIKNESNSLVKAFHSMFDVTKQKRVLFFLGSLLPWKLVRKLPLKHNKEFSEAIQTIRRSCQTIIEEKRAISTGTPIQDTDLLSIAMGNGLFTDEGLIDQVMTFLAAGHETTASVLTWAIYVLALNPKIQQQLRDEIRNNLEPLHAGSDYSAESFSRLPFLYAVCNEVLRMFTPVRLTMREATRDTFLQDIAIPRGTKIMISSCATNMDESLWGPDATEFNPHRWLNVDSEGKLKVNSGGGAGSNYAMLTFLQGQRICVGQGFARAEFACMLASWVGRFEFVMKNEEMADMNKIKIASGITVKPANGMRVSVRPVSGY